MIMLRGILIDPDTRTITAIEVGAGLHGLYEGLSRPGHPRVSDINRVGITRTVDLWVDGEGMLKPDIPIFALAGYPHPLAGRGLLLGNDGAGETIGLAAEEKGAQAFLESVVEWTDAFSTGSLTPPVQRQGNRFHIGHPILKTVTHKGRQT